MPLFVIVACWIRLTSTGPVFFRQERIGRFGVPFKIIKFRTMFANLEPTREITVGRDARVTDIGRLLRRYKIDELPQLINVVRGEMSLVGPRPEVSRYVARYPEAVRATILSVPPGITDWASVEFRDESSILGDARDPERVYVEEILPKEARSLCSLCQRTQLPSRHKSSTRNSDSDYPLRRANLHGRRLTAPPSAVGLPVARPRESPIEAWRIDYNEQRPHGPIGYLTPTAFGVYCQATGTSATSA